MKAFTVRVSILLAAICQIAIAQQGSLMAYYPLASSSADTTGHLAPMILTNTPFRDGAIFCNGIYYIPGNPSRCQAETPVLPPSIFQSFTVSAKFKVDSIPNHSRFPVLVGGDGWRWVSCVLFTDSMQVGLVYNNVNVQRSNARYSINTWHEMTISYDSSKSIGKLYLDGVLACSASFVIDHGPEYDRTFSVTDFSYGLVFRGFLKDLKIYSTVVVPTSVPAIQSSQPQNVHLAQNYPNPFNPRTAISFQVSAVSFVTLKVFDMLGREVATLVDGSMEAGSHTTVWNASGFPSGVYFYRLQAGTILETKKLMLMN